MSCRIDWTLESGSTKRRRACSTRPSTSWRTRRGVSKEVANKAHDVARVGMNRTRSATDGREAQLAGAVLLAFGLALVVWVLRRRHR
jgi:hypothetical protein